MTQQNSPGKNSKVPMLLTFGVWALYFFTLMSLGQNWLVSLISALSLTVGNIFAFINLRKGMGLVNWKPLATLIAVIGGLLLTLIVFPENLSSSVGWIIIILIVMALGGPKDSKKSRTAKDLGI